MVAILPRTQRLELMAVRAREYPHLVGNAGGVRAESVIIAHAIHDSLGLADFLPKNVAENAASPLAVPVTRRAQFVKNAARHESGGGDLRMRVRPFLTGRHS